MEPSVYEELESLLEKSKTWATKGAVIEGYIVNASGEEEVTAIDICRHIGCDSIAPKEKEKHSKDYQSHHKLGLLEKIYLPAEYNEYTPGGRTNVQTFITNLFDKCGGGIIAAGTDMTSIVTIQTPDAHPGTKRASFGQSASPSTAATCTTTTGANVTNVTREIQMHVGLSQSALETNPSFMVWPDENNDIAAYKR